MTAQASSQADYDTARAQLESTRAQIEALDANIAEQKTTVSTAQTNLGYTRITAPIPPKNQVIGLPMSQELRDNLAAQSDRPAM